MHTLAFRVRILTLMAAAGLGSVACKSVQEWTPTVGARAVVVDEFEAELSAPGVSASGDTEYSGFDVFFGATASGAAAPGDELQPVLRVDGSIGAFEYGDVEAIELGGGARWYVPTGSPIFPYASASLVATVLDDVLDVELGTQLGARLGVGLEINLTKQRNIFLDIGGDYTFPLLEAESDSVGGDTIETELEGFALRIGLGFRF